MEFESALQRRLREKSLAASEADTARSLLAEIAEDWHEVPPAPALRQLGVRLLRTHPLPAADALQLAAALTLAASGAVGLVFASADARLNDAARIENLRVAQ